MAKKDLNPSIPEQFLLIDSVIKLTGKSRPTIYRWCKAGTFPQPYRLSNGSVAWKQSDYNQWAQELEKIEY